MDQPPTCQLAVHFLCARALRLCTMANGPELPKREALEEQARRLLEEARRRAGVSVEEMVKRLGQLQPRGAGTRRSWYDWQERPEAVSVLTGLAAIQLLGPEAAMKILFDETAVTATGERSPGEGRDQLQAALAEAISEMAGLRDHVEGLVIPELAKQGQVMTKILADMDEAGILSREAQEGVPEATRRAVGDQPIPTPRRKKRSRAGGGKP